MRVARGELGCFEITAAEILALKRAGILPREKMKAQPAPISSRDPLRFSKKSHEQKQHKISIDLRLELEVAREIFRLDLALAAFELERRVQRVIDLFHKHDERTDVAVAQTGAGIVPLELFDQPARIINADVKLILGVPEKCARQLAQFPRRRARQPRQLRATLPIDQAIFQIDSDLGIGSLKQSLDLAEERLVHRQSDGRASSSRLSN